MMSYVRPAFQLVSVTFACLAVVTGIQAVSSPVTFARSFGIPIQPVKPHDDHHTSGTSRPKRSSAASSYVSLMGVRQLATGVTLLTYARQGKWEDMATLLSILGFVVAGTDGYVLWTEGAGWKGPFHALPGAGIALLAGAFLYSK
ncbi:hypothetical protein BJ742DRAFT_783269 [Cladochytrium replicatum]|nr:hypothetical protein BJ742DRAFT_783269 [Cladochytrium replicatum]